MSRRLVAAFLLAIGFAPFVALEPHVAAASVADEWAVSTQAPQPGIPFDGVQKRVIEPGTGRSTGTPALSPLALDLATPAEARCDPTVNRGLTSNCRPLAERLPYYPNAPPTDSGVTTDP